MGVLRQEIGVFLVPIVRIIVFGGLYWGPPNHFGKMPDLWEFLKNGVMSGPCTV